MLKKNWDSYRWRQPKVLNGVVWKVLKTEWPSRIFCFHVLVPPNGAAVEAVDRGEDPRRELKWKEQVSHLSLRFTVATLEKTIRLLQQWGHCNAASISSSLFFFFFRTHFVSMWNNSRRHGGEGVSVSHHGRLDLVEKKGRQVLTEGWG